MQKLISIIKSIKFRQILTIFLAGCLLFVSTACGSDNVAQAGGQAYTDTAKRAMSDTYDDYDANQGFKGGMNGYNDDPRYNSETAAKTKALVDTSRSRQTNDLGDYVEDIGDRAQNRVKEVKREIPRTIKENTKDAVEDIQDRSENLKDNLSKVPGGAKRVFDEATDTAQGAIEDADRAAKETAKEIKGNFEDLS